MAKSRGFLFGNPRRTFSLRLRTLTSFPPVEVICIATEHPSSFPTLMKRKY